MRTQSFILLSMVVLLAMSTSAGAYSGGTGEPNDPYLIATVEDMNAIGAEPNDWDAHFLLVADINLADYTGTQFNIIGNYIDDYNETPFIGVFDGNGHTISNFTYECNGTNFIGLFGFINDSSATVKDLTLIDPNVNAKGDSDFVGSLAGWLGNGTMSGCGVEGGSVSGDGRVGGLIGQNCGTIFDCYAICNLIGNNSTGGLVGLNFSNTIFDCYAICNVSGRGCTGGLAGQNYATISNCYAMGNVSGEVDITGGLVGYNNYATISNCYATGNVDGNEDTGGLVGRNFHATISNCYSTGSISGDTDVGGLVGYNYNGTVSASFWDIETSGQSSSDGGTGLPTEQMQTESIFTDASWDFIEIWNIGENQTYPFLRVYPAGDINHDDIVNFYDLAILAGRWLEGN